MCVCLCVCGGSRDLGPPDQNLMTFPSQNLALVRALSSVASRALCLVVAAFWPGVVGRSCCNWRCCGRVKHWRPCSCLDLWTTDDIFWRPCGCLAKRRLHACLCSGAQGGACLLGALRWLPMTSRRPCAAACLLGCCLSGC